MMAASSLSSHATTFGGTDMHRRRVASQIAATLLLVLPSASDAIVARPSEMVGPPRLNLSSACPSRITVVGGATAGPAIPFTSLRIGAPVRRGTVPFITGGGGTSNAFEMERRRRAGLPTTPEPYDLGGSALPVVFAPDVRDARWQPYQILPLKSVNTPVDPVSLIFAESVSPSRGRIVSLELSLKQRPTAKPRVRVSGSGGPNCSSGPSFDIFAPTMTTSHIRRLFSSAACNWYNLANCAAADRPRGQVLFVQDLGDGFFKYRWVNYGHPSAIKTP